MKKILSGIAALILACSSGAFAKEAGAIVSIDSIAIMQKSAEGKELAEKIKKEIEQFQDEVKNTQKDVNEMQEALGKQAKVLSKEAMAEKTEEVAQRRKKLEREFADKEEALRASIQRQQFALREKQLAVINEVFEQRNDVVALIDKNTPGLLCVKASIDETETYLKVVDEKYQSKTSAKKASAVASKTPAPAKPAVKTA
jgi:Skp family chaperone for outer membrane proteins